MAKKVMRNPEKWIGKSVSHLDWSQYEGAYFLCDYSKRFYKADNLHTFVYPISTNPDDPAWQLISLMGLDAAETYSDDAITLLQRIAETTYPELWDKYINQ